MSPVTLKATVAVSRADLHALHHLDAWLGHACDGEHQECCLVGAVGQADKCAGTTVTLHQDPAAWQRERLQALGDSPRHVAFWGFLDRLAHTFWAASRAGVRMPVRGLSDLVHNIRTVGVRNLPLGHHVVATLGDTLRVAGGRAAGRATVDASTRITGIRHPWARGHNRAACALRSAWPNHDAAHRRLQYEERFLVAGVELLSGSSAAPWRLPGRVLVMSSMGPTQSCT